MSTYTKDPDAVLDYVVDWTEWLGSDDVITEASWQVAPPLSVTSSENTEHTATVWLAGGEIGETHRATCRIVTNKGRTEDRTIRLRIAHR